MKAGQSQNIAFGLNRICNNIDLLHLCRWRSNQSIFYPIKDVLKTTSPTWVPEAPNDLALQTEPSSSTSLASAIFQGLSAKADKFFCLKFWKFVPDETYTKIETNKKGGKKSRIEWRCKMPKDHILPLGIKSRKKCTKILEETDSNNQHQLARAAKLTLAPHSGSQKRFKKKRITSFLEFVT